MEQLPEDITGKINTLFTDAEERRQATESIMALWSASLNVGPAQLARSILVLAESDLIRLKDLATHYMGDPRDVIMNAEAKAGFPGHYFNDPFDPK